MVSERVNLIEKDIQRLQHFRQIQEDCRRESLALVRECQVDREMSSRDAGA